MVNILLEGYDIREDWLYGELKNYLPRDSRVAVIAFSFRDSRVKGPKDWDELYGKEGGKYYSGIVNGLTAYGISEENISFINYFTDSKESAAEKIESANVIYLPGGLPDKMMDRIREFELYELLLQFDGVVIGYSAGAVIQLEEYHLSPDEDYPNFGYYSGLSYLSDFYLEVHYENTEIQNTSIRKVISEKCKTVYAPHFNAGGIIAENGSVKLLGRVDVFNP